MKGRARPPSSPESEESWTVDCPCGVTFDDGDEMVDCDECGVWVHTVCCHILKGHTSYVCDKCKFKKKKESEESEVAQLLVELPSKTPPLEEKVFTLRTELSREERAHVQGIPGGDPSFFVGVSPVFSRQLWKHTGYVPKVFQFKYNDLPEEKAGPYVLFGDCAEKRPKSPDLEYKKSDVHIEPMNTDSQILGESNADKFYIVQDNHSKREPRKESKYKHRLQQEDVPKSLYHSKRRREESSKRDFTSKKRSKNLVSEDYQGTPKRGCTDDMTVPFKSSRIASRNSRAFAAHNSVEDTDGYTGTGQNISPKFDETGRHGPHTHTLGFYSGDDGVASENLFRKPVATKAARTITTGGSSRSEKEASNGVRRLTDNGSYSETHFVRRDQDGGARNRFDTSVSGDISKSRDHFIVSGNTDGKGGLVGCLHSTIADGKEALQARLNVFVNGKDHAEEITMEQFSPSPVNERAPQLGKNSSSEDVQCAAKQQTLLEKHSELIVTKKSVQALPASDDDECPLSVRVANELHVESSMHLSIDHLEDQSAVDEADRMRCQKGASSSSPLPAQQAWRQDANAAPSGATSVSVSAVGNLHLVVDDSVLSPRSAQTGPSKSVEMSSPTLSSSGVDSRQHAFTRIDSLSPTSEKTLNPGLDLPISSSKPSPNPNTRAYASEVSKIQTTTPHVKSNSSSKHRSRMHDVRKMDALGEGLSEIPTDPPSHKESKELLKPSETKVVAAAGAGKILTAKVALHSKAQPSPHPSASKLMGQAPSVVDSGALPSTQEPSVLQSRRATKPMPASVSHKPERGLAAVHANTLDLQVPGMEFPPRPTLNDEELAFLLHQELNSSPRVARVARVRQSGTGPTPFSTKQPAMATSAVVSSATQKEPPLILRRKNRDESHAGADDIGKLESSGGAIKQDSVMRKEKDMADACKAQVLPAVTTGAEINRHPSPGGGAVTECQVPIDPLGMNDAEDGERRASTDGILTLPGLIQEILHEKGHNVSYDYICEEVLPHWSKLRKHNGERYAYTSHRQAVLDCLRNRSAWSHLIDRGPKTNLGRKRRRLESAGAMESDQGEHFSQFQDGGEEHMAGKSHRDGEMDGMENWPLSDGNKDADLSLPDEVPKGKRRARRGRRRMTTQTQGYGGRRAHEGRESAQAAEEYTDHMVSPFSEEEAATSSEEDDESFVHRAASRHLGRHRGSSSADSEEDDDTDA